MLIVAWIILAGVACAHRAQPETSDPGELNPGSAQLHVTILGLKSEEGAVALALFDSAKSFKDRSEPVATGRLDAVGPEAVWSVEELDPGRYAVAVYQDLNDNGELDRSTIGPPDEPYGFSNNARGTFGPPGFDKAAFEIVSGENRIEIRLR